ncbi:hypothetical protein BIY23_01250 [Wolbachia pipientis]|uniref:Uncharacterized protein n=1 Tax=Wolbachia pipientis TaxID=955 RepID=A0A1E7QL74_WOLPI|nr:hypothetical protein [Wolbachia pipientis]OEY87096.1 hypothetical protein BIY23_01250 [Wolbachia pipientis]
MDDEIQDTLLWDDGLLLSDESNHVSLLSYVTEEGVIPYKTVYIYSQKDIEEAIDKCKIEEVIGLIRQINIDSLELFVLLERAVNRHRKLLAEEQSCEEIDGISTLLADLDIAKNGYGIKISEVPSKPYIPESHIVRESVDHNASYEICSDRMQSREVTNGESFVKPNYIEHVSHLDYITTNLSDIAEEPETDWVSSNISEERDDMQDSGIDLHEDKNGEYVRNERKYINNRDIPKGMTDNERKNCANTSYVQLDLDNSKSSGSNQKFQIDRSDFNIMSNKYIIAITCCAIVLLTLLSFYTIISLTAGIITVIGGLIGVTLLIVHYRNETPSSTGSSCAIQLTNNETPFSTEFSYSLQPVNNVSNSGKCAIA